VYGQNLFFEGGMMAALRRPSRQRFKVAKVAKYYEELIPESANQGLG
jgi:hypothetical protein